MKTCAHGTYLHDYTNSLVLTPLSPPPPSASSQGSRPSAAPPSHAPRPLFGRRCHSRPRGCLPVRECALSGQDFAAAAKASQREPHRRRPQARSPALTAAAACPPRGAGCPDPGAGPAASAATRRPTRAGSRRGSPPAATRRRPSTAGTGQARPRATPSAQRPSSPALIERTRSANDRQHSTRCCVVERGLGSRTSEVAGGEGALPEHGPPPRRLDLPRPLTAVVPGQLGADRDAARALVPLRRARLGAHLPETTRSAGGTRRRVGPRQDSTPWPPAEGAPGGHQPGGGGVWDFGDPGSSPEGAGQRAVARMPAGGPVIMPR
jgi:hypothetical protein